VKHDSKDSSLSSGVHPCYHIRNQFEVERSQSDEPFKAVIHLDNAVFELPHQKHSDRYSKSKENYYNGLYYSSCFNEGSKEVVHADRFTQYTPSQENDTHFQESNNYQMHKMSEMLERGHDSDESVERVQIHLDEMTFARDQSNQMMDQILTPEYKNLREKVRQMHKETREVNYVKTGELKFIYFR
jgi:hypothetical protein